MNRWISKPKQIVKVQTAGASLVRRLAKVEQEIDQVAAEKKADSCICNEFVIVAAGGVAEFTAQMNRICPAHGFRKLDIMHLVIEPMGGDFSTPEEIIDEAEVEEVLNEYNRRLAESKRRPPEDD